MTVNQCFAMNFRHDTGLKHMNPRHGPLSDKSDPLLNLLATVLKVCSPSGGEDVESRRKFDRMINEFIRKSRARG